jgi:hypothetical protein
MECNFNLLGDLESAVKLPYPCYSGSDYRKRPRTILCVFNFLGDLEGKLKGFISPFLLPHFHQRCGRDFMQAPKSDPMHI